MSTRNRERPRVHPDQGGPSMTQQSFRGDTDANAIVRKYLSTGVTPQLTEKIAQWGDFSTIGDLMECRLRWERAQALFAELPSSIRDYCENDPARLFELVRDPRKRQDAVRLGLIEDSPTPTPQPPAAVPDQS